MSNLCEQHGLYPCISCLSYEEWQKVATELEAARKKIADGKFAEEKAAAEAYAESPEGKKEELNRYLECRFCRYVCKKPEEVRHHCCGPKARALAHIEELAKAAEEKEKQR